MGQLLVVSCKMNNQHMLALFILFFIFLDQAATKTLRNFEEPVENEVPGSPFSNVQVYSYIQNVEDFSTSNEDSADGLTTSTESAELKGDKVEQTEAYASLEEMIDQVFSLPPSIDEDIGNGN